MTISGDEQQGTKPAQKKRVPSKRLANTPTQMLIVALVAAAVTLILPINGLIRDNWDVCGDVQYHYLRIPLAVKIYYIAKLMPIALIAAVLCGVLARYVHKIIAIVVGVICLPVLVVLNIIALIFPGGC